ncbi:MAG: cation:proton antiporter [Candidatus Pacearchaeota archaeon]|jgi:Kef-type K+ transport system membrane component KefB
MLSVLQGFISEIPADLIVFFEIGIMILIATTIGFLMRVFKQPLIPAYIITGILIGPLALGLIKDPNLIFSLSQIGIAFLIFTAGLEIQFKKLKEVGSVSLIAGALEVILLFLISFFIFGWFGVSGKALIYIGLIVAFSSTMIIVKLLSDRDELDTLYGRILIGILVIQDIAAIIALSILLSDLTLNSLVIILIKALVFVVLALILSKIVNPMFRVAAKNTEFLLLVSISFLFLLTIGASVAGLSLVIGAFFAGVILANSDYKLEIEGKIGPLREFFALIFFVALGMQLELIPKEFFSIFLICLALILIVKPVVTMVLVRILGYEKRTAFLTGNALAQTSEFSLIILTIGLNAKDINHGLFSTLVLITVLTMYLTNYLINYGNGIFRMFGWILNPFKSIVIKKYNSTKDYYKPKIIIFGCHRMGSLLLKEFKRENKQVLVVDYNPKIIKSLKEKKTQCVYGDFMNEEIFNRINLEETEIIVSTVTDVDDNLLLLKKIKKVNPKTLVFIVAKRISEAKRLYKSGADYVILPMVIGGQKGYELIKKISNNKSLITDVRSEHIKYLDSIHNLLY